MENFWQKMENSGKPILCLAPMADVTDAAFRFIISKYSNIPHITYTEFVSADGLVLAPENGRKKLLKNLEYSEIERPIVAQFFGSHPETMEKAAELTVELGFDGMDINMGCPDRSVEKQKAGAALMKNPQLARELIRAAKKGVANATKKINEKETAIKKLEIPVSVKTRIGYSKDELEKWLPELLAENPAAIIIHARTRKEMSKVPANWERVKRAVEIRDEIQDSLEPQSLKCLASLTEASTRNFSAEKYPCISETVVEKNRVVKTLIIGNGDVLNVEDAVNKCEETGADGVMLGRAVFGNPWLFASQDLVKTDFVKERMKVLIEHIKLFDQRLGSEKSFAVMKKHFKAYLHFVSEAKNDKDWRSAVKGLKVKMMESKNAEEAIQMANNFLVLYN